MSLTTRHSTARRYIQRSRAIFAYVVFFVLLIQPTAPIFAAETKPDEPSGSMPTEPVQEIDAAENLKATGESTEEKTETTPEIVEAPDSEQSSEEPNEIIEKITNDDLEEFNDQIGESLPEENDIEELESGISLEETGKETATATTTSTSTSTLNDLIKETDIISEEASSTPKAELAPSNNASSTSEVTSVATSTASSTDTILTTTPDDSETQEATPELEQPGSLPTEEPTEEHEQPERAATSTATSSPVVDLPVQEIGTSYVVNDSNRHQFGTDECIAVGGGSFYCSNTENDEEFVDDMVYVAVDQDGDNEIFVRKNGEDHKITDNVTEDLAPFYDDRSDRVVWHALINDRYQIMSYSFDTQETMQLTHESYNNMEPSAFENTTVWQAWIDDNWEIMLFDSEVVTQLSEHDGHDVVPHIRGNYIMWQTQYGDEWRVSVYDRTSGDIDVINGGNGTQVENPRLLLVYDSTDAQGDVKTLGYDLDSKEVVPLGALPAPLPQDLPEPDQTGETRAIIQNKPPTKDDTGVIDPDDESSGSEPPPPQNATSTIAATNSGINSETEDTTGTTTLEIPPLDENATSTQGISDVLVPQTKVTETSEADTASSTEHIEDVVIPPPESKSD